MSDDAAFDEWRMDPRAAGLLVAIAEGYHVDDSGEGRRRSNGSTRSPTCWMRRVSSTG